MNNDSPPRAQRPPHPLAATLIRRLGARSGARILEIGAGSGRNTAALRSAGFVVESLDDEPQPGYAGALSTHALLHGTPTHIGSHIERIATLLEPGAPFYATFGSVRDARYGEGTCVEPYVYAPFDGDEAGVAHAFFDWERLRALLSPHFVIESLEETGVDTIAGSWAHVRAPLRDAVHWFALLRRIGPHGGVRALQASDIESWRRMRRALWPDDTDELPAERVFVYQDAGGSLTGMLELSLRSHAESCIGSPVPFIEGLYVDPRARRRGVARALVDMAEQWALAHEFAELASDTQLWNEPSIEMHRALGFTEVERAVHFRRSLIPGE